MRLLGQMSDESSARRFSQYLISQEIPCILEQAGPVWQIWVDREDDMDLARQEYERYQASPRDQRYAAASQQVAAMEKESKARQARGRAQYIDYRTAGVPGMAQSAFPFTILLIAASVLFAALTQLGGKLDPWGYALMIDDPSPAHQRQMLERLIQHQPDPQAYVESIASGKGSIRLPMFDNIRHGQLWRLFSPAFLHFGPQHLIFNLWALYSLGTVLERRCGTLFFAFLFFVGAIGSSVGEYFWHGPNFGGVSGVVYCLFGYVWIRGRMDYSFGLQLPSQTVYIMVGWLFLCMTGVMGPVANAAHLVGLLIGVAMAAIPVGWRRYQRQIRQREWMG